MDGPTWRNSFWDFELPLVNSIKVPATKTCSLCRMSELYTYRCVRKRAAMSPLSSALTLWRSKGSTSKSPRDDVTCLLARLGANPHEQVYAVCPPYQSSRCSSPQSPQGRLYRAAPLIRLHRASPQSMLHRTSPQGRLYRTSPHAQHPL